MPASPNAVFFEGLEIRAEPDSPPDPVYFTNETVNFEVEICNNKSKYEWKEGSEIAWRILIDGNVTNSGKLKFGILDVGDSKVTHIKTPTLSYEGHGVLEFDAGSASGGRGTRMKMNPGRFKDPEPAYSFSVWDESHYKASIERPMKLQKALIFTSVVLILFGAAQLLLASGVVF